jgi:hypothetical protein
VTITDTAPTTDPVALWAEGQFAALGVQDAPEYGSPDWQRLRAEDPRRAAAIVEAAELWRRHRAYEMWLDRLLDEDPDRWFRTVTEDANAEARRIAPALARRKTWRQQQAARTYGPVHQLAATPGWPPIAIPGQPGMFLTPESSE